jgi:hypothetical protein
VESAFTALALLCMTAIATLNVMPAKLFPQIGGRKGRTIATYYRNMPSRAISP